MVLSHKIFTKVGQQHQLLKIALMLACLIVRYRNINYFHPIYSMCRPLMHTLNQGFLM